MNRCSSSKIQMPDEHSPLALQQRNMQPSPPKKTAPKAPLKSMKFWGVAKLFNVGVIREDDAREGLPDQKPPYEKPLLRRGLSHL